MGTLFLYSTNPAISYDIIKKYRTGKHVVWCSELFAPDGAPSSSPRELLRTLSADCDNEDTHSALINRYKKKFRSLASTWFASGDITLEAKEEIIALVNSRSWKIWRPLIYIIYRPPIESAGRLVPVPARRRAAAGEEWQILDLDTAEFEVMER